MVFNQRDDVNSPLITFIVRSEISQKLTVLFTRKTNGLGVESRDEVS